MTNNKKSTHADVFDAHAAHRKSLLHIKQRLDNVNDAIDIGELDLAKRFLLKALIHIETTDELTRQAQFPLGK